MAEVQLGSITDPSTYPTRPTHFTLSHSAYPLLTLTHLAGLACVVTHPACHAAIIFDNSIVNCGGGSGGGGGGAE